MTDEQNIIKDLWNNKITPDNYVSKEKYYEHIFEQYKIFIESANRISERRSLVNSFFLTLHTLIIGIIGFLYEKGPNMVIGWFIVFPLIAILFLCYVWWRLIESYRQLNSAKFKVIAEYESVLPSSPYWRAEWTALGQGNNPKLYRPITNLENRIPVIFGLIYVIMTGAMIWMS